MRLARFLALAFAVSRGRGGMQRRRRAASDSANHGRSRPPRRPSPGCSDTRLTIGLLLPQGANSIGDPMIAAARRAVEQSATPGRRPGDDLNLRFVEAAEGSEPSETAAGSGLADLDERCRRDRRPVLVDDHAQHASTASSTAVCSSCSPTATSIVARRLPRQRSLLPLDRQRLPAGGGDRPPRRRTGGRVVSIAYLDDLYGRGLLDAVRDALGERVHRSAPTSPDLGRSRAAHCQADASLSTTPTS